MIVSAFVTQTLSTSSLIKTRNTHRANVCGTASAGVGELTRRLAAHDEEAFREFHARYFDPLYQFLLVVARGQEDEAREALQETLLRVASRARAFDDEDAFWCWLKAVARNAARDAGRKQRRHVALLGKLSLRWRIAERQAYDGTESRLQTMLRETLNELSSDERALVESKYLDGAATKELSSSTGLTEKAVESRLLRLRRHLRERLLKKLNEP